MAKPPNSVLNAVFAVFGHDDTDMQQFLLCALVIATIFVAISFLVVASCTVVATRLAFARFVYFSELAC